MRAWAATALALVEKPVQWSSPFSRRWLHSPTNEDRTTEQQHRLDTAGYPGYRPFFPCCLALSAFSSGVRPSLAVRRRPSSTDRSIAR